MGNDTDIGRSSAILIGEKLKSAREGKNLTIDQVRKQTHIYSDVLTALEEGRLNETMGPTYVKSFLKKYAGYLGLDPNEIAKEYFSGRQEKIEDKTSGAVNVEKARPRFIARFIYVVSAAFILIAFLSAASFLVKTVAGSFTKMKAKKAIVYSSKSKAKPRKVISKAITPKPLVSPRKETPEDAIPKGTPLYLVLKVKQAVLVKVKKDGVVLYERVLPKGSIESFKAMDYISLYIAKGEAVELVLNGRPLGSPGNGRLKEVEITRKGMKVK